MVIESVEEIFVLLTNHLQIGNGLNKELFSELHRTALTFSLMMAVADREGGR